jgi:DNA-binding NarL/FixJ family response regulator
MQVVGEAADGRAARDQLRDCGTDVAVIDLSMPEVNGTQLTEWITRECPEIKVVALTVHEEQGYLKRLIQAGARGYVLKRAAADELIRALRKVTGGEVYLDPSISHQIVQGMLQEGPTKSDRLEKPLSDRETEVARLIAQGYSNKEVAAHLEISVKTVETHKARLMEKLGCESRAELVLHALDQGWLNAG